MPRKKKEYEGPYPDTIARCSAYFPEVGEPLKAPIIVSAAYRMGSAEEGRAKFAGEIEGYIYPRLGAFNLDILAKRIAALEGGKVAAVLPSGLAAIFGLVKAVVPKGGKILVSKQVYGGVTAQMRDELPDIGREALFFDPYNLSEAERLAQSEGVAAIHLERPSNPLGGVFDIRPYVSLAKKYNLYSILDVTLLPVVQEAFTYGIDFVVESLTKVWDGCGSNLLGVVVSGEKNKEVIGRIKESFIGNIGVVAAPSVSHAVFVSAEDIMLRIRAISENGKALSRFLRENKTAKEKLEDVFYVPHFPGFSNSQRKAWKTQLKGFGGPLLTIRFKKGRKAARKFINEINKMDCSMKIIEHAVNIADSGTLALIPGETTHHKLTKKELREANIGPGDVRISLGRNDIRDLIWTAEYLLSKI